MSLETTAARLIGRAEASGVTLRAIGGVAIGMRCSSARHRDYAREYGDIDFCASKADTARLESFFESMGYKPWLPFNRLNAEISQRFDDPTSSTSIDVFLSRLRMCHTLDFESRLQLDGETLPLADLLLSKLQIIELNEKDRKDIYALVIDHALVSSPNGSSAIDADRIAEVCGHDWGWYRTVRENVQRCLAGVGTQVNAEHAATVSERLDRLLVILEEAPKSRRWKFRAKVGERVRWYEVPEDPERRSDV